MVKEDELKVAINSDNMRKEPQEKLLEGKVWSPVLYSMCYHLGTKSTWRTPLRPQNCLWFQACAMLSGCKWHVALALAAGKGSLVILLWHLLYFQSLDRTHKSENTPEAERKI